MANFNIGALLGWSSVAVGEVIAFDVQEASVRAVEFDFMASEPVVVLAVTPEWTIPVAAGSGLCSVRFVTDRDVGITFVGHEDATLTIRTRAQTQVIEDDGSVSYTSIEPRQAQPSDEMARMMNLMKLNQMRRDQELRAQFEAREEELIERIERARPPTLTERQAEAAQEPHAPETASKQEAPTNDK